MIDKKCIEQIVMDLKNKYSNELKMVNESFKMVSNNYNMAEFQNIIENQKSLNKNIILDVLGYFPILKKCDFVMLNGSYAMSTNILYSDKKIWRKI